MSPTPLGALLERAAGEYRAKKSVYDIPEAAFKPLFEEEPESPGFDVLGSRVQYPVGPAAGPHTQIAPNFMAAYLSGARIFELKTVQVNDALDIEKPCIDALDEGHNVEWSTELTLDQAREEYLRGWMALRVLRALFAARGRFRQGARCAGEFLFNMSVGYTLEGIRSPKMDAFVEGMRAPARTPFWGAALAELEAAVTSAEFRGAFGRRASARARKAVESMPESPVHSVTLSTMHGCPPDEIERIGRYLIEEKGFSTYVKLNPTLLGYDRVRDILDRTGWKDIKIDRESFEKDLRWTDALALIASLDSAARARGVRFGLKLSNTLANANPGPRLPGRERYMSGRALFPITVRLAAELACALPEPLPFSFCGGVSAFNAAECAAAGLGPLTAATDILKPGGYLRLSQVAREAAGALSSASPVPSAGALSSLAEEALERPEFRKGWKQGEARLPGPLPAFDCFAAPCTSACPVLQKVPEYIRLASAGWEQEALAMILADNPLPFITGTLCDHVCQTVCCRNDYEGPVGIRGAKLACARLAQIPPEPKPRREDFPGKAAVIGAGPAGLACAHYLAREGVPVTVFEKDASPGGVPANVIPRFRILRTELARDIQRIRALGVEFRFNTEVRSLVSLEDEGFTFFFAGAGAPVPRELPLKGEGVRTADALEFLASLSECPETFPPARHIVVAGGGNTAMDAVRAAARIRGVKTVRLSYRRTVNEMPADREERENALAEAREVNRSFNPEEPPEALLELTLPESASPDSLTLRRMKPGAPDSSGRRTPVPTDETFTVLCDLLIAAVGESPDRALLERLGIPVGADGRPQADPETGAAGPALYVGGDALRGPSSIISAIADGRRSALAILRAAGIEPECAFGRYEPPRPDPAKLAARGCIREPIPASEANSRDFLSVEAERCLECDAACLRCVEVCPNRANTFVAVPTIGTGTSGFRQGLQILHIDALCNECGNCGFFCPYDGLPYRDKPTLFASEEALKGSENFGFAFTGTPGAPDLILRTERGGLAARLPHSLWTRAAREGASDHETLLKALALVVLTDHAYLTGGYSC